MVEVVWSGPAKKMLAEIVKYYRKTGNHAAANKIRDKIYRRPVILYTSPRAGQREELLRHDPREFRYLVEGKYKIVYFIEGDKVVITTVFDCRRNPEKMIEEPAEVTI